MIMDTAFSSSDPDKSGEQLKAQRFQMLADIAKELSGDEVVFSTHFDTIIRLRTILRDPDISIQQISTALVTEPLISTKLLQLANSVAYNPSGQQYVDLKSAITRLGLNAVRNAALAIATAQLMRAKGMSEFSDLTRIIWEHSLKTAAAAKVLAKTQSRINAEEAMLAGLVHDLGVFYMLYRATLYDELRQRPDTLKHLIMQWHESVGVSLLNALGMPAEIVEATEDHDRIRPPPAPIRSLADIVYVANMLAGGHFEWSMQDEPVLQPDLDALEEMYGHLRAEIEQMSVEMRQMLVD